MSNVEEHEDVDGEVITQPIPGAPVAPPTHTLSSQQPQTYLAEDGTLYYWDSGHNMWLPQVCLLFLLEDGVRVSRWCVTPA